MRRRHAARSRLDRPTVSAPFTVLLARCLLRERLTGQRAAGVLLAMALVGIAVHRGASDGGTRRGRAAHPRGGLGWALGNLSSRLARPPRPLHLVCDERRPTGAGAVASLVLEGPSRWPRRSPRRLEQDRTAGTGRSCLCRPARHRPRIRDLDRCSHVTLRRRRPLLHARTRHRGTSSWLLLDRTPAIEITLGAVVVLGVLIGATAPAPPRPSTEPRLELGPEATPPPTPDAATRVEREVGQAVDAMATCSYAS
jgi:O-acetylserine/cysteine efflux transporter